MKFEFFTAEKKISIHVYSIGLFIMEMLPHNISRMQAKGQHVITLKYSHRLTNCGLRTVGFVTISRHRLTNSGNLPVNCGLRTVGFVRISRHRLKNSSNLPVNCGLRTVGSVRLSHHRLTNSGNLPVNCRLRTEICENISP